MVYFKQNYEKSRISCFLFCCGQYVISRRLLQNVEVFKIYVFKYGSKLLMLLRNIQILNSVNIVAFFET